jgi:hypothetical protein
MKGFKKNLRLKIATVIVTVLTTLGLYGVIQAHPLIHAQATGQTSSASAVVSVPASPDNTASASGSGAVLSPPASSAPLMQQPVTRTRAS